MGFLLSSRSGHLCVDGKRVLKPHTEGLFPSDQFCDGDLSIPSTDLNILTVAQCFLDLYINPMGMLQEKRTKGKKWLHSTLEIEKEFGEANQIEESRSLIKRISQGFTWSRREAGTCLPCIRYIASFGKILTASEVHANLKKPMTTTGGLKIASGDMIDLAEEQYRVAKIPTLRDQGKKLKPLGQRYSATSRTMAHKITEVLSSHHYDANVIDQYANAYMKR